MPDLLTSIDVARSDAQKLDPSAHLATLERETKMLLEMRDGLKNMRKTCTTDHGREFVDFKISQISLRLVRAQMEMTALSAAFFVELQKTARNAKYPPIPAVTKSVIRYADE